MRMQAIYNGVVVADSDDTVVVEGNHYFPADSLVREHFSPTETTSVCPWKGTASYLSVTAGGASSTDAAWRYPEPLPEAEQIRDHVAFWKDVEVRPAP